MSDALPYAVLPRLVLRGVEIFVDSRVRFLYLGMCGTLETHVDVLGEVPAELEFTVPKELLGERQW